MDASYNFIPDRHIGLIPFDGFRSEVAIPDLKQRARWSWVRSAHDPAGAQTSEDRLSRQRNVREIRKARDQPETSNNVDQRRKRLDGQDY